MIDAMMNASAPVAATETPKSDAAFSPASRADYQPRLTFYHPNMKGQGSAVAFEIEPATSDKDGSVYVQIATQSGTSAPANAGQPKRFASFDWRNRITVKLNFAEVSEVMLVLCGMAQSLTKNGRNGFFHDTAAATTTVELRHGEDPARPGFILGISKAAKTMPDTRQFVSFVFSPGEALGLRLALEHSMGLLAFGIPRARQRAQQPMSQAPMDMGQASVDNGCEF